MTVSTKPSSSGKIRTSTTTTKHHHQHRKPTTTADENATPTPTAASTSSSPPGAPSAARYSAGPAIQPSSATFDGTRKRHTDGSLIRVVCGCGPVVGRRWIWNMEGRRGRRGRSWLWRLWGLGGERLARGVLDRQGLCQNLGLKTLLKSEMKDAAIYTMCGSRRCI